MYRVGIITASDKGARGEREDKSAAVIGEIITGLGWQIVSYRLVSDNPEEIRNSLLFMADEEKLDLVLTTGGTGLGPRDNTPEVTKSVIDRDVPGIAEAIRYESLKKTPRAMLSRAVAGLRKQTLIINLPGSPKAVRECLEVLLPALPHGLETLSGYGGDCGNV